jgi:predicted transcriptional regulator
LTVIEAPSLRDQYLTRTLPDTRLAILDTLVHQQPALKATIDAKAQWTGRALVALALGVVAMAVLVVVFG